jgi:LysM repeat protein
MPLVRVVDAAHPFDFTKLDSSIEVVCGYVGGNTPHVWTQAEVDAVTATGRRWWPIWTMPEQTLIADDGASAAVFMQQALKKYTNTFDVVLLDIEHVCWVNNFSTANEAASAWAEAMSANHFNPHVYGPHNSFATWIADWTGNEPATLPSGGVVGWQYASDTMLQKPYDISVFDSTLLDGVVQAMPIPLLPAPAPSPLTYTVAPGDTLSGIASRYGTTWQNLYAWNRGTIGGDPNRILPGQILYLHGAAPVPPTSTVRHYIVKSGDSLSAIASRYGMGWQQIYNANRSVIGNDPNRIYPGQNLVIP